jgi:hypothetical protein
MTAPEANLAFRMSRAENDITAIYGLLSGIQRTVDQHTVILAQHTAVLNEHTVVLNEHTVRFERIETRLDQHGEMLKEILRRLPTAS